MIYIALYYLKATSNMSKNLSHLAGRQGLENNLFDQLGIAARSSGTPDAEALDKLQHMNFFLEGKYIWYRIFL